MRKGGGRGKRGEGSGGGCEIWTVSRILKPTRRAFSMMDDNAEPEAKARKGRRKVLSEIARGEQLEGGQIKKVENLQPLSGICTI